MKKIMSIIMSSILSITIISGCSVNQSDLKTEVKENSKKVEERVITDSEGKEVHLPAQIDRVATNGALNQIVLMLGGADKIVATSEAVQNSFFATVYPRIKEVPAAFGGAGPGVMNKESILQQHPQVIFGSGYSEEDKKVLESGGVITVGIKLITPEDMKNTFLLVGKVLGEESEKKAREFVKYYDNNVNYAKEKTKGANKIKVFVASGDGSKGSINTIPGNDINTSYLDAAGGINIAAESIPTTPASGNSAAVDFEFLINNQPEVIIANSRTTYDYIMDKNNGSQWQELDAVKNRKVYLNPKGVYLWSVRSAEGVLQPLWLGKILHTELFQDLDIKKTVKDFYKTYYNYDLNDKETEDILNPKA
ncbi:ABC transporter substrate-binding protein [Clostridium chromiireducens]|uniref:ABC transporter substrate-binding protein n=1 Tax=Clostridium chromiireducens TaxID=225345 RepID=UPI003AF7ADC1